MRSAQAMALATGSSTTSVAPMCMGCVFLNCVDCTNQCMVDMNESILPYNWTLAYCVSVCLQYQFNEVCADPSLLQPGSTR